MNIKTNTIMDNLLNQIKKLPNKYNINFILEDFNFILDKINENFIETNNWLIVSINKKEYIESLWVVDENSLENDDSCYIEYSNNDFYINDYLNIDSDNDIKPLIWLLIWTNILKYWNNILKLNFPQYNFKIILSYDIWEFPWAKITFYKKRKNIEDIITDDLNSYNMNWIMTIEN